VEVTLGVGEIIGYIAGFVTLIGTILAFFIRRTVFAEIDALKEGKQDKTMCEQIEETSVRDREEIKLGLKEGVKEFRALNKKIDRIMWALKLPYLQDEPPE